MERLKKFSNLFYILVTTFILSTAFVVYENFFVVEDTTKLEIDKKLKYLSTNSFTEVTEKVNPLLKTKMILVGDKITSKWKKANWKTGLSFNDWKIIKTPFEGFEIEDITYYLQISPIAKDPNMINFYLSSSNYSGPLIRFTIYNGKVYLDNSSLIKVDKIETIGKKNLLDLITKYENTVDSKLFEDIKEFNKTTNL